MISLFERQNRRGSPAGFHVALSLASSLLVSGREYSLKRYAEVEREVRLYDRDRLAASCILNHSRIHNRAIACRSVLVTLGQEAVFGLARSAVCLSCLD